jgi:membrane protease YdiL (CAAX protease family)
VQNLTPQAIAAFVVELSVAVAFGCAAEPIALAVARWPRAWRILFPALFVFPYIVVSFPQVSVSQHLLWWKWFALYAALPVVVAWLLDRAAAADPEQRGNWRDGIILLALGLAVDLRWFDTAWPAGLRALNELLLVDVGLYGFLAIRRLSGTGFDFCVSWGEWKTDWKTGLRELVLLTPPVLLLGLALGFIHPHRSFLAGNLAGVGWGALRWVGIFFFTAVPEELFFRAWAQNLLERRVGRRVALMIASVVFGLSHFNKRSTHFNWRYVLLATIAGIFYGRAWRERRRVPASTITHASVDWIWSLWF